MIWAIVCGIVVIAGIWTAALLLGWPLGIPIGVSVLVLAAIGILIAFRFVRSRQRAAELEAELHRQSKDRTARPEAVLEIQGRVRELATALRRNYSGNRLGNGALYASPWYLVLGPPGAGKSTALQNSGLALRAAAGRQPKTRTTAPTRGIEPWLADGGVLIDTAGRYALGDGEEAEWSELLAALRRTRRQKPLDGVVLAYNVSELVSDRPEQLEEKAKRLRSCLEELGNQLGSVLPVYLLLTKADLLPGFSQFHDDVGGDASDRIWGATFEPRHDEGLEPAEALKAEFDLMKEALHAHLLARLPAAQRTPDSCAAALRFPVEFETVRAPLARLVEELFRPSSYQETPLLRGFYFTSCGNGGGGFEAVGAALQGPGTAFAVHTSFAAPSVGRSYFLGELFPRVVFPDRHFAT
ncbi:MAG TPA: type VI secretion protein IcmF/TssM N-terminal domain-containing protein, partial [Polyangiaceae bacterium]|nr:type VI secretion protein IcmF/TssM N-terminal domain-containing protein [Polyangiaceae bacterium]